VALSKTQAASGPGKELVELSKGWLADGKFEAGELAQLKAWLARTSPDSLPAAQFLRKKSTAASLRADTFPINFSRYRVRSSGSSRRGSEQKRRRRSKRSSSRNGSKGHRRGKQPARLRQSIRAGYENGMRVSGRTSRRPMLNLSSSEASAEASRTQPRNSKHLIPLTGSWGERPLDLRRPRAQP